MEGEREGGREGGMSDGGSCKQFKVRRETGNEARFSMVLTANGP